MRTRLKPALFILFAILAFPGAAKAHEQVLLNSDGKDLWLATGFKLRAFVSNQVEDGCLSEPARLESVAATALRNRGFHSASAPDAFIVWVYGYATNPLYCAIAVEASVSKTVTAEAPRLRLPDPDALSRTESASLQAALWHRSRLISGPQANLQERLEATINDLVGQYAEAVEEAKRRVRAKDPGWLEKGPRQ